MTKLLGMFVTLALSLPAAAVDNSGPPFSAMTCTLGETKVNVNFHGYRQTTGAGPATIDIEQVDKVAGGWTWTAAEAGTRLEGYYFLTTSSNRIGPVRVNVLYSPEGNLSGGWIETPQAFGSAECKITATDDVTKQCYVDFFQDCNISPKRVCCECVEDSLVCS